MEISFFIGFGVMWTALLWARSVSTKEIRNLDDSKKAEIVNMVTEQRGMQIAILVTGVVAFYVISYLIDSQRELWFGLYGLFILGWMIFRMIQTMKKYREKEFSEVFIKAQLNANIIRVAGITTFFVVIGLNFLLKK